MTNKDTPGIWQQLRRWFCNPGKPPAPPDDQETEMEGKPVTEKHYPKGLDDRMRDQDGTIRKKRGDTKIETLRQEYGENFAKGHSPEATLAEVLEKEGVDSLHQLLKKA